jgi:hypothetical protein
MNLNSIQNRYWSIYPCVATKGEGVAEGIQNLIEIMSKKNKK